MEIIIFVGVDSQQVHKQTENAVKQVTFQIENNIEDNFRQGAQWKSYWEVTFQLAPDRWRWAHHAKGWLREFQTQGTANAETSKQERSQWTQSYCQGIWKASGQEVRERVAWDKVRETNRGQVM